MKSWYSIRNQSDTTAEISIYDEIGFFGITAKSFLEDMKAVGDRKIVLRINSPGGDVFDGMAIYNRLKGHAPGVQVMVDGVAASVAGVIAMAGNPVCMAENSLLMIHNPTGCCAGDSEDMRSLADLMDKVRDNLAMAYENKSGKSAGEIVALMDAETWLTAKEAVEMGFADEVTGPIKIAALFDMSKFRNAPHGDSTMTKLRAAIVTALSLTDPADGPLTEDQLIVSFTSAVGDINAVIAERDTLKAKAAKADADLLGLQNQRTEFFNQLKGPLLLTDEQVANLVTDKTIIPAAIENVAKQKAVTIAASQHVPPVVTDPKQAAGGEDDIKADFAAAHAESDPMKRAVLMKAASDRLAATKKKTHGAN